MKKLLFIFGFVFIGQAIFAQAVIPKFGITMTTVDLSSEISQGADVKERYGFIGGLGVELPVTERFAVQPELMFHQKGWISDYNTSTFSSKRYYRLNYLELPVMLKLKFGFFYINAGPYAAVGIRGRYRFVETDLSTGQKSAGHKPIRFANNTTGTTDYVYLDNPLDAGFQAGFGFKLFNRMYLDFRYAQSFVNIWEQNNSVINNQSKNRGFQVTIGFPNPKD